MAVANLRVTDGMVGDNQYAGDPRKLDVTRRQPPDTAPPILVLFGDGISIPFKSQAVANSVLSAVVVYPGDLGGGHRTRAAYCDAHWVNFGDVEVNFAPPTSRTTLLLNRSGRSSRCRI
jgi:hypothetical protein